MLLDLFASFWLTLHLICVDIAMAGPLLMIVLDRRASNGDATAAELLPRVGRVSLGALILGGLVGFAYGVGLWSESYAAAIAATGSRWKFTIAEYFFSLALVAVAGWLTERTYRREGVTAAGFSGASRGGFLLRATLLFAAASNLMYHFPIFFEVLSQLRRGPLPELPMDGAAFRSMMSRPAIVSKSLHVVLASLAVVGVMFAWMCQRRHYRVDAARRGGLRRWYRYGLHLAAWPTLIQAVVGTWVLTTLPRESLSRVTGGTIDGLAALCVAGIAVIGLAHALVRGLVATEEVDHGMASSLWMAATVGSMCWLRIAAE